MAFKFDIWQEGKFQLYDNKESLPRTFLLSDFEVIAQDQQILENNS